MGWWVLRVGVMSYFEFGSVFCLFACFCLCFTYFVCLFRSLSPCWLAVLSLLSACACFALLLPLLLRLSVRFCCAALCLVLFLCFCLASSVDFRDLFLGILRSTVPYAVHGNLHFYT